MKKLLTLIAITISSVCFCQTAKLIYQPAGEKVFLFTPEQKVEISKDELKQKHDNILRRIAQLEKESQFNTGLKLTFAFGYGGRSEIAQAMNSFVKDNPGREVTEEDLAKYLIIPDLGDVDLLIRTGGDHRVSNFLLWQIAYAELYFTNTKWPDFSPEEFCEILDIVSKRERRFGATTSTPDLKSNIEQARMNKSLLRG